MVNRTGERTERSCIGADLDGAAMDCKWNGIEYMEAVHEYLQTKRIDDKTLDRVFFDNAYQFFKSYGV